MLVLMDIEWVESPKNNTYVTQFSASRVSDCWDTVSSFDAVIALPDPALYDPEHVAFRGREIQEFAYGEPIEAAFIRLSDWMQPDDILCVWHGATAALLKSLWKTVNAQPIKYPIVCVRNHVQQIFRSIGYGNPYTYSEALGIVVPEPMHDSRNDVAVMLQLFRRANISQTDFENMARMIVPEKSLREKNREIIAKSDCQYFFAHNSSVFHTGACSTILAAKKIEGARYYKTAAAKRRPCKLCRPVPDESASPELADAATEGAEKELDRDEVITVRLLTGEVIPIKRGKIVGFCRNALHPGKMTSAIMKQHDCLGKECWYFQKYHDAYYWEAMEKKQKEKKKRRQAKKQQKRRQLNQDETLLQIRDLFQQYADDTGSELDVIQVDKTGPAAYTVFYVSDNTYADWGEFPEFIGRVRMRHSCRNLRLTHIRDVDGHFVTRNEYYARVR